MLTYLARKRSQTLASKLEKQIKQGKNIGDRFFREFFSTVSLLTGRGLAFTRDYEVFGSPNNGNFLGLLELIAKCDPLLRAHINQPGNKRPRQQSYLSKTICQEVFLLLANKVQDAVVCDIK